MAWYSGLDGKLYMKEAGGFVELAAVRNWTFSQNHAVLDTTVLGDTDRTLIDGVRSMSGSCSLFYYNPDTAVPGSPSREGGAARLLQKLCKPYSLDNSVNPDPGTIGSEGVTRRSNKVTFRLQAEKNRSVETGDASDFDHYMWVQAWITNYTMTMSVGEVLSADITFEVDGAPVDNTFTDYTSANAF